MYDPKIYIRDYGSPTYSTLVHTAPLTVTLNPVETFRELIVEVESELQGSDRLLLSGDAQVTGTDVLLLSGTMGALLLSAATLTRVTFNDIGVDVMSRLRLSGDAQATGYDLLLLSGDAQISGSDALLLSE